MAEELSEARRTALVEWFEHGIPFNIVLGVKVDEMKRGRTVLRIPWKDEFVGDVSRPAVHGGVISALADMAGGGTCFTMFDRDEDRVSTVDLRVDYLRPGTRNDLVCVCEIVRMGNRVGVTRMEVFSGELPAPGEPRQPIATGQGVYNILRPA